VSQSEDKGKIMGCSVSGEARVKLEGSQNEFRVEARMKLELKSELKSE
jgi:hypothetical protein